MPRAALAFLAYLLLTIAATWPLARGLSHDVPWDLGDPLLVMWILAWDCEQILRILGGDASRIAGFFDANIFHPVPLTLAYSEHLIAQALQILPVYAITGNPILSYNILFLSTWVLSGFGMYLFVRELTGSAIGASTPALKPIDPIALQATIEGAAKELLLPGAMVLLQVLQGSFAPR